MFARRIGLNQSLFARGAIVVVAFCPLVVSAQNVPVRGHNSIAVPNNVLSVRTDTIRAQAQYLQAMGDFQESIGIARIYNAQAAAMEIRNHSDWVKSYFELKDLNKAYWRKEHPQYLDRQFNIRHEMKRRNVDNPQLLLERDPTGETLNWFLRELGGTLMASELERRGGLAGNADESLRPADIHHIRLTDGPSRGGRKATFRADEAKALETRWPLALRAPEFDFKRRAFELARDRAVQEANNGEISRDAGFAMRQAADDLMIALERNYPKLRRHSDPKIWEDYKQARDFLSALALAVYRVLDVNDRQLLDGSLRFQGDTVSKLVVHMCRNGLEFAPPESGDEGTYSMLLRAMQNTYRNVHEFEQ